MLKIYANRAYPDQTPHYAASDLSLCSLQRPFSLVGKGLWVRPFETVFQSVSGREREKGKNRREKNVQMLRNESKMKIAELFPLKVSRTASAVDPCPTFIQFSKMPRHWKLTQHHRTTRPSLLDPFHSTLDIYQGGKALSDWFWRSDLMTTLFSFDARHLCAKNGCEQILIQYYHLTSVSTSPTFSINIPGSL